MNEKWGECEWEGKECATMNFQREWESDVCVISRDRKQLISERASKVGRRLLSLALQSRPASQPVTVCCVVLQCRQRWTPGSCVCLSLSRCSYCWPGITVPSSTTWPECFPPPTMPMPQWNRSQRRPLKVETNPRRLQTMTTAVWKLLVSFIVFCNHYKRPWNFLHLTNIISCEAVVSRNSSGIVIFWFLSRYSVIYFCHVLVGSFSQYLSE